MRGSVRKRKSQWNWEEKSQHPSKVSQSNTWHRRQGDAHGNGRIGPNGSNYPFHGKNDMHMDDGLNENPRGQVVANCYAVGRSPSYDEKRRQIHIWSQETSREQLARERRWSGGWGQSQNRSGSPVSDLKWGLYEGSETSRNGPGELSQPHRNFAAGRWRRGSQCRSLCREDLNDSGWEQSEIGLAGFCGSRHNQGGVLRSRSRSSNGSQKLSRSRSRSQGSVQISKRELCRGRDRNLSQSRELSKPCRNFAAGRCSRGHHCRFLHQDEHNYRNRRHSEIEPAECGGSGYNYGRAFSYDNVEMYKDYLRDKASHGYGSSCDEGREEPLKNNIRSNDVCKDFLNGKCHRGSSCKYVHCSSGDKFDRSNRNQPFDQEFKHERILNDDTLCKYFAMGKCCDSDYCRFSHGGPADCNSEGKSKDYRWGQDSYDKNVPAISDNAKSTGWGNSVKSMDFNEAVVENSSYSRRGHRSPNGYSTQCERSYRNAPFRHDRKREAHRFGGTSCKYYAMGECRYGDQCSLSHDVRTHGKTKGQSKYDGSDHGMGNETRLWDGRTWDDIAVVSDAARSTGWGNKDAANLNCTNALDAKSSNYNWKPKCQSQDGKSAHASDGGKKLWNGPTWDDIASMSDASKCTTQGKTDVKRSDHGMDNETKLWDDRTWDDIAVVSDAARSTGWGNKNTANLNCTNALNAKSSNYNWKPKCQSQDGKLAHASDGGKKLWNGPTWDDIASMSDASKCTTQGKTDVKKSDHGMDKTEKAAENSTYYRTGHSLSYASGYEYLRNNANVPCGHDHKPEANESCDTLCKYFANGKCRDGRDGRFSHDVPAHRKPKCQSRDGRQPHVIDDGKILWNGPTWDDVSAVSEAAKFTGWGHNDVRNMDFTNVVAADVTSNRLAQGLDKKISSCSSPVLKDKALESDEHQSSELASGSGGAITGFPESIVVEKISVKEEPQSIPVPSHSRKLNGTGDGKNLWKGPAWDDVAAVSDASKSTRHGISDDGKMKFTDEMTAANSRPDHSLSDTSGNEYLRSNKNAPSDHNHKHDAHENGDTLCKYFATRKCRDGNLCRISHGSLAHMKSKCQSRDGRWAKVLDDGKILWNGPTWDDVSAVSEAAKFTGWGHSNVRNMDFTDVVAADSTCSRLAHGLDNKNNSCGSPVLKDKALEIDEHQSSVLASGSGGAIMGVPVFSVKEENQPLPVPSHSQRLNETDDGKNLWNCPTLDKITAVSGASKSTRHCISDDGKMKFTDEMTLENLTYHRPGHSLSDTSGNEYLRNNRNAPSDHNRKRESHENGDTLCKSFATRECRDGDCCSHGGLAQRKSKRQSQDGRWAHVSDDGKKLWNGPTWDDVSAVSQAAKFIEWGNSDVRNINYTVAAYSTCNRLDHCLDKENISCGSPVLKDKAAGRDEFSELASGSGGAISGDPESMVAAKVFLEEEPQTILSPSQSQKLNGTEIPFDWDVMQETSNLQLSAAVAQPTLSESSNVEQHFIDRGDNNALATCSRSQNEVNLSERMMVHTVVVTRQSFKQGGDSLGSEPVSSFDKSSQDKQILPSIPSNSSFYTSHLNGPVQRKVSPFSQMEYQAEYSETAAVLKSKIPQVTCGTPLDPASKPGNTTESFLSNSTEEHKQLHKRPKSIEILKDSSSEQEYHNSLKLKGLYPIAKENSQTSPEKCKHQQEGGHLENVEADRRVEEGNRNNDEKTMLIFKNELVDLVKDILFPTWMEGGISKDTYKSIVKKVVDKVCGASQSVCIPKTRENIDRYLSSCKPNITKLVQGYLEIYPKELVR